MAFRASVPIGFDYRKAEMEIRRFLDQESPEPGQNPSGLKKRRLLVCPWKDYGNGPKKLRQLLRCIHACGKMGIEFEVRLKQGWAKAPLTDTRGEAWIVGSVIVPATILELRVPGTPPPVSKWRPFPADEGRKPAAIPLDIASVREEPFEGEDSWKLAIIDTPVPGLRIQLTVRASAEFPDLTQSEWVVASGPNPGTLFSRKRFPVRKAWKCAMQAMAIAQEHGIASFETVTSLTDRKVVKALKEAVDTW